MDVISCALALLSGVIGAGFASGRELQHFFARHAGASGAAIACACAALYALFVRLPHQIEHAGCGSLQALCRLRFGHRLGRCCGALFFLLSAVTSGAMLAACAELTALVLPVHHAYALGLAFSLIVSLILAQAGLGGLALPGAALCVLSPLLFVRLLSRPAGEAQFEPAVSHPAAAMLSGCVYAALNAAMLGGALPSLLALPKKRRNTAALLFCAMMGALLLLGTAVCRRHRPLIAEQPLPFVVLSQQLGKSGYLLVAACMYAAALSTLCAMQLSMMHLLRCRRVPSLLLITSLGVFFARVGFSALVSSAYPTLGLVCAGLLFLLCMPAA